MRVNKDRTIRGDNLDNLEFANKIYTLRCEKGISQKELGEMLGVSNKAVSKWENGDSIPKTATLVKIAEIFELDISELMGAQPKEVKAKPQTVPPQDDKIDSLMAENARLRSQITQTNKRKTLAAVIAAALCVAAIAATGIFAFWTGSTSAENKTVKDLGKDGTKIEFADCTFEPLSPLDETVRSYETQYLGDSKEATYTDLGGKETKIIINCDNSSDFISVDKGSKKFWYINREKHIKINKKSIHSIELIYGKSIAKSETENEWYKHGAFFTADDTIQRHFVENFTEFYSSKKETKNKRAAELFLGSKGCTVSVELTDDYNTRYAEIGEFFTDDKGKVYYYDYSDTKTYDVGKEVAEHVTQSY